MVIADGGAERSRAGELRPVAGTGVPGPSARGESAEADPVPAPSFRAQDRNPLHPDRRARPARMWEVPFAEVVIDVSGARSESVVETVDRLLVGDTPDLRISLVGEWSLLGAGRNDTIDDPVVDLRLVREHYRCDGRVRFPETLPGPDAEVPFRMLLSVGTRLREDALCRLHGTVAEQGVGLVLAGTAVRWECTAAFDRANGPEAGGRDGSGGRGPDTVAAELRGMYEMELGDLLEPEDKSDPDWWARWRKACKRADTVRTEAERWERRILALSRRRWLRLLIGRSSRKRPAR